MVYLFLSAKQYVTAITTTDAAAAAAAAAV
jgi:hypothetical protein